MAVIVLAAVVAYLIGSVPTAYLVGRYMRGIDIREYGSGSLGGANTKVFLGLPAALAVSLADVAKGLLAVGLARLLGVGVAGEAVAMLAVVVGHNWSVFIGLSGGRGLGPAMGTLLLFDPLPLVSVAVPGLAVAGLARLFGRGILAEVTLAVALLIPAVAWWLHGPTVVLWGDVAVIVALIAKRLMGNAGAKPSGPLPRLLLYRLLMDRDVASYGEWVYRRPTPEKQEASSKG